eukprot:2874394-Pyramimonas_sp.AAC.1
MDVGLRSTVDEYQKILTASQLAKSGPDCLSFGSRSSSDDLSGQVWDFHRSAVDLLPQAYRDMDWARNPLADSDDIYTFAVRKIIPRVRVRVRVRETKTKTKTKRD